MGGFMSSIVISGDTSGAITLAAPSVAGTNTATLPASTGTVMVSGNMPAFSAYQSSATSLTTSVNTKIAFQGIDFDTANKFTSNTTYTPNVAGYYQVNAVVTLGNSALGNCSLQIYKNGSIWKTGYQGPNNSNYICAVVSSLVYLNGSTDYIEIYANQSSGGTLSTFANSAYTYFQAVLVRAT